MSHLELTFHHSFEFISDLANLFFSHRIIFQIGYDRGAEKREKLSGKRHRLGEMLLQEVAITPEALSMAVLKQRLDRLKNCDIFSNLPVHELITIREWVSEVSLDQGEVFITQDQRGDSYHIMIQGGAEVFRRV